MNILVINKIKNNYIIKYITVDGLDQINVQNSRNRDPFEVKARPFSSGGFFIKEKQYGN